MLNSVYSGLNRIFRGNNILILLLVILVGIFVCRLLKVEGLSSGPYPQAFQGKNVGQSVDRSKVVGLVPEPNRATTSPSLIAEVASLPDPDIKNFIRQNNEIDSSGALKVIQNAPLVKPTQEKYDDFVRFNSVAPTGPVNALTGK